MIYSWVQRNDYRQMQWNLDYKRIDLWDHYVSYGCLFPLCLETEHRIAADGSRCKGPKVSTHVTSHKRVLTRCYCPILNEIFWSHWSTRSSNYAAFNEFLFFTRYNFKTIKTIFHLKISYFMFFMYNLFLQNICRLLGLKFADCTLLKRGKTLQKEVPGYDTKLQQIVRLQFYRSRKSSVPLNC